MTNSLNPEDITVVRPEGLELARHDPSKGNHDDNDTNDSGKKDVFNQYIDNIYVDDED
ncbi:MULTISPECIES: hypothetical protein [unclassified Streptomyces]|uniref:hypothetical protein n=1 Tax=unclassified Streptomyces TaxID=2593676 RepID=UPI000A78EBBE|nr:hypothetical protein [Streptomyces sp. TSRI0281]